MVELVVLVVVPGGTGTGTIAQNAAKARTLSFTFDFFLRRANIGYAV